MAKLQTTSECYQVKSHVVFLGAALLAFAGPGIAATIVGPSNAVAGIDDLLIDGGLYDVTFKVGPYATVFLTPPAFSGNSSGAQDARNAIVDALDAAAATTLITIGSGGANSLFVPYQYPSTGGPDFVNAWAASLGGNSTPPWSFASGRSSDVLFNANSNGDGGDAFAVVTPVPLPASDWLLLGAILGFGVWGRGTQGSRRWTGVKGLATH